MQLVLECRRHDSSVEINHKVKKCCRHDTKRTSCMETYNSAYVNALMCHGFLSHQKTIPYTIHQIILIPHCFA
jgi:hypothetical protein